MGEMPDQWPPEFAKRATENLDLVLHSGSNDVTQTLLTLYALVVVPIERKVFKELQDIDLEQMRADGWPLNGWVWEYVNQPKKEAEIHPHQLKSFLRMLRNALAHSHFEFESAEGRIMAIQFNHKRGANHICGRWTSEEAVIACRRVLEIIGRANPGGPLQP